jgi:hypothetical protein
MHPILAGGLLIGGLCSAWIFVNGFAGFYKDPVMSGRFVPIVSMLEIGALIWALRKTAAQGRTYSGQVVAGTAMALIGAAIIFCASLIFTTVLYPNYVTEINEMSREVMRKGGQSDEQINAAIGAAARWQSPVMFALAGVLGTVMTGVVASAVIALWIRARSESAPTARV